MRTGKYRFQRFVCLSFQRKIGLFGRSKEFKTVSFSNWKMQLEMSSKNGLNSEKLKLIDFSGSVSIVHFQSLKKFQLFPNLLRIRPSLCAGNLWRHWLQTDQFSFVSLQFTLPVEKAPYESRNALSCLKAVVTGSQHCKCTRGNRHWSVRGWWWWCLLNGTPALYLGLNTRGTQAFIAQAIVIVYAAQVLELSNSKQAAVFSTRQQRWKKEDEHKGIRSVEKWRDLQSTQARWRSRQRINARVWKHLKCASCTKKQRRLFRWGSVLSNCFSSQNSFFWVNFTLESKQHCESLPETPCSYTPETTGVYEHQIALGDADYIRTIIKSQGVQERFEIFRTPTKVQWRWVRTFCVIRIKCWTLGKNNLVQHNSLREGPFGTLISFWYFFAEIPYLLCGACLVLRSRKPTSHDWNAWTNLGIFALKSARRIQIQERGKSLWKVHSNDHSEFALCCVWCHRTTPGFSRFVGSDADSGQHWLFHTHGSQQEISTSHTPTFPGITHPTPRWWLTIWQFRKAFVTLDRIRQGLCYVLALFPNVTAKCFFVSSQWPVAKDCLCCCTEHLATSANRLQLHRRAVHFSHPKW